MYLYTHIYIYIHVSAFVKGLSHIHEPRNIRINIYEPTSF